ncbi:MAG: SAVED domain-containing protein [Chloroflexi bacterium]|nr:SAVED domain-containing protein [Chloroflexota bacterium]
MTSPSAARRAGDEFQDVYGWFRALELLRPARKVWRVSVEDPSAGKFDDVTLRPEAGSSHAPEFAQVKFHVDEAGHYSTEVLTHREKANGRSLLEKAWQTWQLLRTDAPGVQLLLVTTFSWDPEDAVAHHLRRGNKLTREFVAGTCEAKGIRKQDMLDAIEHMSLLDSGATPEPAVSLYVHTILKEPVETDGDYELDWRDHFAGEEWLRGHRVHDPEAWNNVMLPELVGVRERIMADTSVRLVRARGKARLSAWFATGWIFSGVAGWTLEVDQNGNRWRNDAPEASDVTLAEELHDLGGDASTLAIGVSITGDLSGDVLAYLAEIGNPAARLLHVKTSLGTGLVIRGAGDLTALTHLLRDRMRGALGQRPQRVLLFYFGPLAGAAFIGASLNAVAPEIQVYEDQNPGYSPSFTFKQ